MLRVALVASGRRHQRLESCPCCRTSICQSCLYQHILSVWEEGMIGNGRSQLVCPMGCGRALSDDEIRSCLHRQHGQVLWSWIGRTIMQCLIWAHRFKEVSANSMKASRYYKYWLYFSTTFVWRWIDYHRYRWLIEMGWFDQISNISTRAPPCYEYWLYFTTTTAERRDLQRYEQWSWAVAYRSLRSIQRCPAPDCDYAWEVFNPEYRRNKFQHERRPVHLWYKPPAPEPQSSMMKYWFKAAHVRGRLSHNENALIQQDMKIDGRFMICAKCHATFCGLCRQPWSSVIRGCKRKQRSCSHSGVSCESYQRRMLITSCSHNSPMPEYAQDVRCGPVERMDLIT
jgi:hypothetical protein